MTRGERKSKRNITNFEGWRDELKGATFFNAQRRDPTISARVSKSTEWRKKPGGHVRKTRHAWTWVASEGSDGDGQREGELTKCASARNAGGIGKEDVEFIVLDD